MEAQTQTKPHIRERFAAVLRLYLAELVDEPRSIEVIPTEENRHIVLEVRCAPGDVGPIVGKGGRHARALRLMFTAMGLKRRRTVEVRIPDYRGGRTEDETDDLLD